MSTVVIPITGDEVADQLLADEPLALVLGMLLDQQVPMEWAFRSPARLKERLGGTLDAGSIAAMAPADLEAVFKITPALHRFPGAMARRTHDLCQRLVDTYGGEAATVWTGANDAADLWDRLRALPGFGEEKSAIFLALLGKRLRVAPSGWEAFAGPFADDSPRSVADIDSRDAFDRVRAWKKAQKAQGRSKAD